MIQIQTLMDINMGMTGVQTTVMRLNDKLASSQAALEKVQESAIKLGWYSHPMWSGPN